MIVACRSVAVVGCALLLAVGIASELSGQTAKAVSPFEVAVIRPHDPGERMATIKFLPSGEVRIAGITIRNVILLAYGLRDYQLSGGSKWMDSQLYDIVAKSQPPSPGRLMQDQYARLRALLADRLNLKAHREKRPASVYYLNRAPGGVRLARADGKAKESRGAILPWSLFVNDLAQRVDRPLIDNVRLDGAYVIALRYTTDDGVPAGIGVGPIDPNDPTGQSSPSLSTALQQQLGLRLDPGKGDVEFLVIDSVARPPDN